MDQTIFNLIITIVINITIIYFLKDTPFFAILIMIFMIIIVDNTIDSYKALKKTTIECYRLGGCNKDYINRNIIEDYEIELLKLKLKEGK